MKLNGLREKVEHEIKARIGASDPGPEKRAQVIDQSTRWLDDQTHWPSTPIGMIAEALDGVVYKAIVGELVDEVYERVKREQGGA